MRMLPSAPRPLSALPLALVFALAACGGGGGSDTPVAGPSPAPAPAPAPAPTMKTGVFIDAPVQGLDVLVDGVKTGSTDAQGQFQYPEGKTVTFKLGQLTLGSSSAPSTVTPADLSGDPQAVLNILVALQSLDSDRNPANGITLSADSAAKLVTAADLSQKGSTLASLVKDLPSLALVSERAALTHFLSAAQGLTPNSLVLAATDKLAGFWHSSCDAEGRSSVTEIKKVAPNRVQEARALVRNYGRLDCSGSFTETLESHDDPARDLYTVMGATQAADGSLTLQAYSSAETISATLAKDGNSFTSSAGQAVWSSKRLSEFAHPAGSGTPTPTPFPAVGTLMVNGGDSYPMRVSLSLDDKGLINGGGYDFHKVKGSQTPCTYGPGNADNCEGAAGRITLSSQHGMFSAQGATTPTVLIVGPDEQGFTFTGKLSGLDWLGTWTKAATTASSATGAGSFAVQVVFGDGRVPGQPAGPSWSGPPSDKPGALRVRLALDGAGLVDVKTNRSRYDTHVDSATGAPCTVGSANLQTCNGRSDVFVIVKAAGPLSANGAATATALQLIDGNGSVWTGTVTGKTWAGVWTSAPGVLPALSVNFSVELSFE